MGKGIPEDWFPGPWVVCEGDTLETKPSLRKGEVMKHKSGNTMLNCPACGALQFTAKQVEGDDDSPTLRGVVVCGNGGCVKCKASFTSTAGRTVESEQPPKSKGIDWSKVKGVKPPPPSLGG